MNELVKFILSLSLSGSILAIVFLLSKTVLKNRISKKVQYYILIIILIRFIVPFSFSSNDSGGYAGNERTKKIGNVSAQQLYFANEVAKELNKTHPGRFRLLCLAYWHSHSPPVPRRARSARTGGC